MRKYQKKQLLELTGSLGEAHDEIKRQLTQKNIDVTVQLLSDCQNSAVTIGGFIEQLIGEGALAVALLEEYCELLYQMSTGLEDAESNARALKKLRKQLMKITSGIHEFKVDELHVLFIPYKASMWDSMESIWLAAKDDPICEAIVMPIPYYDRQPGGEFGQMHYEGGDYPDYVPVTDWQGYNIEEQHPDVIVTHNPYDGGNFVTSVHPDFYSQRLKDLTELLVYVPYFVSGGGVEEHFCVCAGVLFAGRVIVQSEKIKDTYTRVFNKYDKEDNWRGAFGGARTKFLALGSPKFDKAVNSRPEDFDMPEEWADLIENEDGSKKPLVLYNTSIGSILKGNEDFIYKLRYVFDVFKNRDDVVLWWRPHPLSVSTIQSMRPQLLPKYLQLAEEYRREGYGIYDDAPDMYRALCLTSFFYGDLSSLAPLYQAMGKPLLGADPRINSDPLGVDIANLVFINFVDAGGYYWFTALNFNGLLKMDKQTWDAEYVGSLEGEGPKGWVLYRSIIQVGPKLYFSPSGAGHISVYDMESGMFEKIAFNMPDVAVNAKLKYDEQYKFFSMLENDGLVYFLPSTYPGILIYDVASGTFERIDGWIKHLNKLVLSIQSGYFVRGILEKEKNRLLLPFRNANAVLELNTKTHDFVVHVVNDSDNAYMDVCFDGSDYWLLSAERASLIQWNPEDGKYAEYKINIGPEVQEEINLFQKIVRYENSLYLVPFAYNKMIRFDLSKKTFNSVNSFAPQELGEDASEWHHPQNFLLTLVSGTDADKVYVHTGKTNNFIKYDPATGEMRERGIRVAKGENFDRLRKYLTQIDTNAVAEFNEASQCYFWEQPYGYVLENWLDMVTNPDNTPGFSEIMAKQTQLINEENANLDGSAGAKIFEMCKKEVL